MFSGKFSNMSASIHKWLIKHQTNGEVTDAVQDVIWNSGNPPGKHHMRATDKKIRDGA